MCGAVFANGTGVYLRSSVDFKPQAGKKGRY